MPLDDDLSIAQSSGFTLAPGAHLPVLDGHRVWWCEGGDDPPATPVLMVHGGPGGQSRAEALAWWQGRPVRWLAIDQRGCGRSLPLGETAHNDLDTLVDDMERLRTARGIERWGLAAGSWGVAVALSYALRHPSRVAGLFLRSAFLGTQAEVERYLAPWERWLGEAGAEALGSDVEALRSLFQPATAPRHAETGLTRKLAFHDEARLAQAWAVFDDLQSRPGGVGTATWAPALAAPLSPAWVVFRHYAAMGWGLDEPLLARLQASGAELRERPMLLVHGALDASCDPQSSRALAGWHGTAELVIVPQGGHRMGQAEMAEALHQAAGQWLGQLGRA